MRYEVTVLLFLLISVFFALKINDSLFNFKKYRTLPRMKVNQMISKHRKKKFGNSKSSAGTSVGTSTGDKRCTRKDHVVYVKTHKTGSTTAAGIFWRYV